MNRALLGFLIVIVLGSILGSSIVRNVYVAVFWFLSLHWLQMLLLISLGFYYQNGILEDFKII